ncbi:hypothetical protein [Micromonospora sp. WMMD1082]|uniref:hypothetical protein n=1 Tax=Micromonospora sp. WMMD1082 TaxID=3016104 RepID=UPI0024176259|nr:hypothetical protein [Micromonospora sp. WMMD1082]MDG4796950.1 hypothetical protein [Micromonospora sp. WMMD1082]
MSGDVLRALMADNDADRDRYVNREVLRHAVMRAITCSRSGRVLDVARAVLVTMVKGDSRSAFVLDGAAWDEVESELRAKASKLGMEVEVIDGRQL